MATQAQKDKAVTAAEKRLATATKRAERLGKRIEGYDELVVQHGEAVEAVKTAQAELDWAKSRPVSGSSDEGAVDAGE